MLERSVDRASVSVEEPLFSLKSPFAFDKSNGGIGGGTGGNGGGAGAVLALPFKGCIGGGGGALLDATGTDTSRKNVAIVKLVKRLDGEREICDKTRCTMLHENV